VTYQQIADLAGDTDFQRRLASAVTEQAKTRSDYTALVALRNPVQGSIMFSPFVSTEPGFADAYGDGGQDAVTDGMLLAAVQANWTAVNDAWASGTPTP
jgi:hypothetical protein